MKEVKKLFSKFNTALKPFFNKVKRTFKSINKIFKSSAKKINDKYKKANSKNKFVEPIVVIGTSCLLVLVLILSIKSFTTVEEVNITSNSAEYLYYEGKFDEAIEEYKKMQESDEWPIWTVKIADIYSLQGEVEKSNTLLREALTKRDRIIKEEGYEEYKEKDLELISSMLFTFTLNKEYEDVISFGEQYINDHGKSKDILNTLFATYIQNNDEERAKELLDEYNVDENSSYDLSILANMNILMSRWDEGIELLKDAWIINSNELKIYNVINEIYLFDKDTLIEKLEEKLEETSEDSYKMFLAGAYSNDKETLDKALSLIEDLEENNEDNFNIDIIKYNVYKTNENEENKLFYLDSAVNKAEAIEKDSYSTYYLLSLKALNNKKYEEALTNAKKSINSSTNNFESFNKLIPQILIDKKEFESVEVYYRTALSKEPYNYELLINLANYYENYISNNEKARDYYEYAIKISKNDGELYKKVAELDIEDGNYEKAIENIREAIKFDDNSQEYYRILGALYLKEGKNEEGIEITRKAYSMNEKDVTSLNNASWYYLTVEKDLLRGYENLKAAYSEMPAGIDESDKNIIINNYTAVKKAYDEYIEDNNEEFDIIGLELIY